MSEATWPSIVKYTAWIIVLTMGILALAGHGGRVLGYAYLSLVEPSLSVSETADLGGAEGSTSSSLTGTASWYGPGSGVATQWCTWTLRHQQGCGWLAIQSHDTGITVVAPVIDWCQCYRNTPQERIVDLQLGVVAALGLDPSRGLYPVTTWLVDPPTIPDTAMSPWNTDTTVIAIVIALALFLAIWLLYLAYLHRGRPDD